MMKMVFPTELYSRDSLIIHSKNVTIEGSVLGKKHLVEFAGFSIHQIKKSPIRTLFFYKEKLQQINTHIKDLLSTYDLNLTKIVIGTDKDNFTQILLNNIYSCKKTANNVELHAVEEGLGFYVRENKKDKLLKLIYRSLTPILFGFKLEYHKLLATDKRISFIHLRLPELRPKTTHNKNVILKKIPIPLSKEAKTGHGKNVLIFSFPNQDYDISDGQKADYFKIILSKLKGYDVIVKPHPRENVEVFKNFNGIKVLSRKSTGEKLNYHEYVKIINFASSVIIDILMRDYPTNQIYTIFLKNIEFSFFEATNCIDIGQLKLIDFEA